MSLSLKHYARSPLAGALKATANTAAAGQVDTIAAAAIGKKNSA